MLASIEDIYLNNVCFIKRSAKTTQAYPSKGVHRPTHYSQMLVAVAEFDGQIFAVSRACLNACSIKLLQDCADPLEISSLARRAAQGDGSDERSGHWEK